MLPCYTVGILALPFSTIPFAFSIVPLAFFLCWMLHALFLDLRPPGFCWSTFSCDFFLWEAGFEKYCFEPCIFRMFYFTLICDLIVSEYKTQVRNNSPSDFDVFLPLSSNLQCLCYKVPYHSDSWQCLCYIIGSYSFYS